MKKFDREFDKLIDILCGGVLYDIDLSLTRLKSLEVKADDNEAYILVSDEYAGKVVDQYFQVSKYGYTDNPSMDKECIDELNLPTVKKAVFETLRKFVEKDEFVKLVDVFEENGKTILKLGWYQR